MMHTDMKRSLLLPTVLVFMVNFSALAQVATDSTRAAVDSVSVSKPQERPDPKAEARKAKRAEAKLRRQAWPVDAFKGWHVGFIGGTSMTLPNIKSFSGGELTGTDPAWGWRVGMECL